MMVKVQGKLTKKHVEMNFQNMNHQHLTFVSLDYTHLDIVDKISLNLKNMIITLTREVLNS